MHDLFKNIKGLPDFTFTHGYYQYKMLWAEKDKLVDSDNKEFTIKEDTIGALKRFNLLDRYSL